jgi:flagellar M-ring protein FliF
MAEPEKIASQQQPAEEPPKGNASPFKEAWSDMSMGRRLMLMAAASLIMGGFIALLLWINKPDYQVLYSGLAQSDASKVVEKLKELKIPFQLEGDGTVVKIPQDQVYETRLAMASAGLPRGQGIGFEVFNEVKMGTTEFVQKINYQRALQGELARTIASFSEVDDARVHIVMPRDSLFVEEEKKPTAAVVLRLATGRTLAKSQIQGIVHLVAGSVPDLDDAHVTVVDSKGNLLFRKDQDSAAFPAALTASQLEYQRTTESQIANKVQTMLEEVLGLGRAVVRVSADIDFTRTEEVKDLFDPDQAAVRSETRSTESSKNAGDLPIGAPDNRFTLAQRNAAPGLEETGTSERKREDETTNFEISRTKRQTLKALGGLNKLSVAVMVDGPYKETVDKEGTTTRAFTPRSAKEMGQLTELVRRAVGYDENRGDEVTVANVPFALPPGAGVMAGAGWQEYLDKYGRQALNLILALLFFLMVVRPLMKYLVAKKAKEEVSAEAVRVGPGEELPPGEERDQIEGGVDVARKLGTRDMILALAQQDPERTTAVLRSWIHQN